MTHSAAGCRGASQFLKSNHSNRGIHRYVEGFTVNPDIEIIKKGLGIKKEGKKDRTEGLWWMDEGSLKGKKQKENKQKEESTRNDLASMYKNIFRTSQM